MPVPADPTNLAGKLAPYTFLDSDGIGGQSRPCRILTVIPDPTGQGNNTYNVMIDLDLSNPADVAMNGGLPYIQRYGVPFSRDPLQGTVGVYPI
jgi:hypothetical protein